jgi:hypothetical protein
MTVIEAEKEVHLDELIILKTPKTLRGSWEGFKDYELLAIGRNAYRSFTNSVFLTTIQHQSGDDQAAFRQALPELREARVSVQSWELLSSRCAINLSKMNRVLQMPDLPYSYKGEGGKVQLPAHVDLNSPVLYVAASHEG